jgi:hypothetical protein
MEKLNTMNSSPLYDSLFKANPYGLDAHEKNHILLEQLQRLTHHHKENCPDYSKFVGALNMAVNSIETIPFIPVSLFKELELKSVGEDKVKTVLTSSGTTSQIPSKIFLDEQTSLYQTKALHAILSHWIGKSRLPMIIIDSKHTLQNKDGFSARAVGTLGLMHFGHHHFFALNEDNTLDNDGLDAFLNQYGEGPILIFGFTFMVWKYFAEVLLERNAKSLFKNVILFHSGGWKKMINGQVSEAVFNSSLNSLGIHAIHNFYGMVEQVGSIFVECSQHVLHTSIFSDILIRDLESWKPCINKYGLVQVVSMLPHSYPGHSLLTEDEGILLGVDDCPCGLKGKYFKIKGRLKQSEVRGCSDVDPSVS